MYFERPGNNEQYGYERALKCLDEVREKIEKLQFDKELYEEKCISCLRGMQYSHVIFGPDMFSKAWRAFNGEEGVTYEDGEPFDLKTFLKIVLESIFEERHRGNAELKEVCACGYEGYAYLFRYSIYGATVEVQFPMYALANGRNWLQMKYVCLHEESPHSWASISEGLRSQDAFKPFNEWLDKKAKRKQKKEGK